MSNVRIYPAQGKWTVRADGGVIAESTNALEVTKGDGPFVIYFPREDVAMAFLDPSDMRSTCPIRGEAVFYHITSPGVQQNDAAYSYESATGTMAQLNGLLAFDAGKVTVERL